MRSAVRAYPADDEAAVAAALSDGVAVRVDVGGPDALAVPSLAATEERVATSLRALVGQDRLRVVRGPDAGLPADEPVDGVHAVRHAERLDLDAIAALLDDLPDECVLVLAGDADLLPPFGPGAPFSDLVASGAVEVHDVEAPPPASPVEAFVAEVRRGVLPPPTDDHSVVAVVCDDDEQVRTRVVQLVADSIPRTFDVASRDVGVLTVTHRGSAGTRSLAEALSERLGHDAPRVLALAEAVADPSADAAYEALVLVLPGQAAGMLSRPLVLTGLLAAGSHVSVVSGAGAALPRAVTGIAARKRWTRLAALLRPS